MGPCRNETVLPEGTNQTLISFSQKYHFDETGRSIAHSLRCFTVRTQAVSFDSVGEWCELLSYGGQPSFGSSTPATTQVFLRELGMSIPEQICSAYQHLRFTSVKLFGV